MGKDKKREEKETSNLSSKDDADANQYGKPFTFDEKFKGPAKNRSCTDVICCLLFIIFIGGLVVVAYFAFSYGDPRLLLYPVNSNNEICGYGKQRGKPNLLFFDMVACGKMGVGIFVSGCPTPQICVSECPSSNFVFNFVSPQDKKDLKYCKDGVDKTARTAEDLVKKDDCASYTFESEPLIHRCVPKFLVNVIQTGSDLLEQINANVNTSISSSSGSSYSITNDVFEGLNVFGTFLKAKEFSEKIVEDVVTSWWMILIGLLLAMIFAFIWIVVMRWIAGVMVWFTIFAFIGLFGFACGWSFYQYLEIKDEHETVYIHFAVIQFSFSKPTMFLTFGIISGVILLIILLILLFLCSRIRIAISLIKEGSKAIGNMMFTLIFPLVPFALQIGVIAFWLIVAVFLASTGRGQTFDIDKNDTKYYNNSEWVYENIKSSTASFFDKACDAAYIAGNTSATNKFCGFLKNQEENFVFYTQIYNLFMLFWLVNFVIALGQMTLAGAFASYYWAFNKPKDIPSLPLLRAFGRCFRYHLGSLAFGSLIIAIVQIMRVGLEYLDSKLKGSENAAAKFFLKCLKCCFWCLEKFLKFLNKNAYILIAAHGKNFCISAKNAFKLILRNVVRVVVVDKVTDFLLLIGKLVVVAFAAAISFFFFDGRIDFLKSYTPSLNFYIVPIVLVTLGAYVIASCFFSVYGMAVSTLFLCFLEDLERNDGSAQKPYFMSKSLMKVVGKKNVSESKKKH